MILIVGLGNPGIRYKNTRHNCGFMAIDYYAKNNNLVFKNKFNGEYAEQTINNEKVIFLKPQTYMNLSGECVSKYINFFHIDLKDVYIIYDDVDFEIGTFKIKRNGSSGGHNGINNIISLLKTEEIKRIRIGISKNDIPLIDYVLKKLSKEEKEKIDSIMPKIAQVIGDIPYHDIDYLMEKYNGN